jgi:hypothetical protein
VFFNAARIEISPLLKYPEVEIDRDFRVSLIEKLPLSVSGAN